MDSSGRRVYPAKALGFLELFGSKRKRECDMAIGELFFNSFVGGEANDFDLREFFAQALGEPLGSNPEIEAMVGGDEKLAARAVG